MDETVENLQENLQEIDKEEEKEKRIIKLFEWQLGKEILELFNDKEIPGIEFIASNIPVTCNPITVILVNL